MYFYDFEVKLLLQHFGKQTKVKRQFFMEKYLSIQSMSKISRIFTPFWYQKCKKIVKYVALPIRI